MVVALPFVPESHMDDYMNVVSSERTRQMNFNCCWTALKIIMWGGERDEVMHDIHQFIQ